MVRNLDGRLRIVEVVPAQELAEDKSWDLESMVCFGAWG